MMKLICNSHRDITNDDAMFDLLLTQMKVRKQEHGNYIAGNSFCSKRYSRNMLGLRGSNTGRIQIELYPHYHLFPISKFSTFPKKTIQFLDQAFSDKTDYIVLYSFVIHLFNYERQRLEIIQLSRLVDYFSKI